MPNLIKSAFLKHLPTLERRCEQTTESLLCEERYRLIKSKHGKASVLGVAHCDCVPIPYSYQRNNWSVSSPRLDDRLGVWLLLDVLPELICFDVLLTDNEEIGESTAQEYEPQHHSYNWMFSFDRCGIETVLYDYAYDEEWSDSCKECFYPIGLGTFSDISFLEHLEICGVNVATGYIQEHTPFCRANLQSTLHSVRQFIDFYKKFHETFFPFPQFLFDDYTY